MLETLWIDKYRPKNLDNLDYHPEITNTLKDLARTSDFPHMIFYGPEGAGKKTRVINFVQEVYGNPTLQLIEEMKTLKLDNPAKSIEYSLLNSNYHIEITPADNEYDDRHIIQKTVKDIASTKDINQKHNKKFKILIINEADRLSKEAQGSLRRTMEKYMSTCRMILVCKNIHKLIAPIRSRCINIRIPAPTHEQIYSILHNICKDNYFDIEANHLNKIIKESDRNMKNAISELQCYKQSKKHEDIMHPFKPEIKELWKLIYNEQSPSQLLKVRNCFYDLLVNVIEPSLILKMLLEEIINSDKIKDEILMGVIFKASTLEQTLAQGSKAIVHLECFAANVMEAVMECKERH